MERKQVMRVHETFDDKIVRMIGSKTCYTNEDFFKESMKESDETGEGYSCYPVQVQSLKIDWIINTQHGKEFLEEIRMSENTDIFRITSLQTLVEFIYNKQKKSLLWLLLPIYMIQLLSFESLVHLNEAYVQRQIIPVHPDEHYIRKCNNEIFLFEFEPEYLLSTEISIEDHAERME